MTRARFLGWLLTALTLATLGAAIGQGEPTATVVTPETCAPLGGPEPFPGMVTIAAARFVMGTLRTDRLIFFDERPWPIEEPIPVEVGTYFIDRTETTNAEYAQCVTHGACRPSAFATDPRYNASQQPVVGVSWDDARTYCEWRDKRLPRETEWELAARLGTAQAEDTADPAAWHAVNSAGAAHPVAQLPANPAGVYDMLGNVWEWCDDWYHHPAKQWWELEPIEAERPHVFVPGRYRVLRGGGWNSPLSDARSTLRFWWSPERRGPAVGFRCAMDPYE